MAHDEQFGLSETIGVIESIPATLSSLFAGVPQSWVEYQEEPEAWSPRTVLIHYVHNELTNWPVRVEKIISDDQDRGFAPFQQMPEAAPFLEDTADELLAQFTERRAASVARLKELDLSGEDLARTGIHPNLGEVTLAQLLASWMVHDLNHLHQIAKTLSKKYTSAVGPWRVNLAIIDA